MVNIIAISGKARAGKNSLADAIGRIGSQFNLEVVNVSFADKLKQIARDNFSLTEEQVNGNDKEVFDERWQQTPRQILQKLGEGYRNISKDYWVDVVLDKFKSSNKILWTNADCRYVNEAVKIKEIGGIVVRVERDSSLRGIVTNPNHPSEVELDSFSFDDVFDNNGPIEKLDVYAFHLLCKYILN